MLGFELPQFFATLGTRQAEGIVTAQQTVSASSASQSEPLLASMTPVARSLSATFSEITVHPAPPLQVPVTTEALVIGTTDTLPSSIASSEPTPTASQSPFITPTLEALASETATAPVSPTTLVEIVSAPQGQVTTSESQQADPATKYTE